MLEREGSESFIFILSVPIDRCCDTDKPLPMLQLVVDAGDTISDRDEIRWEVMGEAGWPSRDG